MLIDNLVIDLNQKNCKIWLCKPDLNKTVISRISEADNQIRLNLKFGNVSEMVFKIPYFIEKDHIMIKNENINLIKDRYLIKLQWGNYIEYLTIRLPSDNMAEDSDLKSFTCFSLQYELNDKSLRDYNAISYNAHDALIGNGTDKTGILSNTLWTLDYVDPDFNSMYRTINISSSTVLEGVFQIATTFSAIVLWNTSTRTISLYKQENIGLDRGLKFSYGHYLKTLQQDINSDDVCTRLKVYGKSNLTIQEYNATGANYIEDYSYFLYPFQRDASKVVLQSSNYMSDSLCNALLDYQALIAGIEPITKISETGTTTTNIKITAHGLVVGDYIVNTTRTNTVQQVITVVDVNNITVASITGQTIGDSIDLYKDGTFGKLLYQKIDQQTILTTKQNELSTLQTDMNIITDNLDTAQSSNISYSGTVPYIVNSTVVYNSVPYRCILASTGNLPTNTTYWENLVTAKTNKQTALDAKNAEITTVNSAIASLDSQTTILRNAIKIESSLTLLQLQELNQFIIEKEVINDYIDNAKELLLWAKKEFVKINTPPINLKIGVVDLFKTFDKSAQIDRDKIVLAETVTVQNDRLNINVKAKIIEINIDFESYDALTVTIANVQQILTDQQKFIKMLNQAISTSTQVDLNSLSWTDGASTANEVSNILNQVWTSATRAINAGVNESVTVDRRGITIQDPTDPNKLVRCTHGVIGLSADGGNTFSLAIDASGVYAQRLIGQIIAGVNLKITNSSGSFTFDENGATISGASLTITNGLPTTQINPTFVNQVDTATTIANSAQATANTASINATTALNTLADIASDSQLTAVEKQSTKKEWDIIVAEKPILDTQADTYTITTEKTAYDTSYTTLSNYITPLLTDLTTTTAIVGTTFRANFADYYNKKIALLNKITAVVKAYADQIVAIEPIASGKIFNRPASVSGASSVTGAMVIKTPIISSYMTEIDISGYNYVGATSNIDLSVSFYAYTTSFINCSFINRGNYPISNVRLARDASGKAVVIIGDVTNTWAYPKVFVDKATITYNIPPDTYKDGWTIAFETDLTPYTTNLITVAGIDYKTTINTAQTSADAANTEITNMSSDDKISPVEKIALKKDWDAIVAEKSPLDTQATTYSITTEKTTYDNAYTTLNTYLNTTYTVFTNMTTTTDLGTGGGATLRSNFASYYTSKVNLLNAITTATVPNLNLLKNGGAEIYTGNIPDGWLTYQPSTVCYFSNTKLSGNSTYTISGNTSFEISTTDTTANSTGSYYQDIPVVAGQVVTMSALLISLRCNSNIGFNYFNASDVQIGALNGTAVNTTTVTPITLTATIPANCVKLRCYLYKGVTTSGQTSSYLFADNVKLEKGSIVTPFVETDLGVVENANNSVQQGTAYNSVVINSTDGVKATYANGDYTQMYGGGFFKHTAVGNRDYHYLLESGTVTTITRTNSSPGDGGNPLSITTTLPVDFKGKNFKVTPSIKTWDVVAGYMQSVTLNCTTDTVNGTFTITGYVYYYSDSIGSRYGGMSISYVATA